MNLQYSVENTTCALLLQTVCMYKRNIPPRTYMPSLQVRVEYHYKTRNLNIYSI